MTAIALKWVHWGAGSSEAVIQYKRVQMVCYWTNSLHVVLSVLCMYMMLDHENPGTQQSSVRLNLLRENTLESSASQRRSGRNYRPPLLQTISVPPHILFQNYCTFYWGHQLWALLDYWQSAVVAIKNWIPTRGFMRWISQPSWTRVSRTPHPSPSPHSMASKIDFREIEHNIADVLKISISMGGCWQWWISIIRPLLPPWNTPSPVPARYEMKA